MNQDRIHMTVIPHFGYVVVTKDANPFAADRIRGDDSPKAKADGERIKRLVGLPPTVALLSVDREIDRTEYTSVLQSI